MNETLSLFGGPLYRFGCRTGLIRNKTNSLALGLVLGAGLWTVLLALTLIEGHQDRVLSIAAIGGHIRLLLVIPLFFVTEALLADRPAHFIRTIVDSQVVAQADLPALDAEVARLNRLKDAWQPEAVFLILAALLPLLAQQLNLPGATAAYPHERNDAGGGLTAFWYWAVCMTVFRFLLLRWMWRLALWTHLLWRVSRLRLQFIPTHPDGSGGIGYLEVLQAQYAPLVMGISAVFAAALAEEIVIGTRSFETIYLSFMLILLADALLFIAPLTVFAPRLYASRERGIVEYTVYAAQYLRDFEGKWVRRTVDPAAAPLAAADVQSLADMINVINGVRRMSLVPAGPSLLLTLGIAALLPFLPLSLLKYPVAELAARLVQTLLGL
jgi:hypothetical protein